MALTECWECGEEVSSNASECPNCGVSHPESKVASKMESAGEAMQGCGCLLTLLITVPFLVLMCAG